MTRSKKTYKYTIKRTLFNAGTQKTFDEISKTDSYVRAEKLRHDFICLGNNIIVKSYEMIE